MRKGVDAPQDEDTGLEGSAWAAVYVDLPLRLAGTYRGDSPSRTLDIGGVEVEVAVRTAHLPHDADDLLDGDLIEVTAGENAGLVLRIVEAAWQDQATARRVPVVAVDRPEEWS
jgi:hypothetical protein